MVQGWFGALQNQFPSVHAWPILLHAWPPGPRTPHGTKWLWKLQPLCLHSTRQDMGQGGANGTISLRTTFRTVPSNTTLYDDGNVLCFAVQCSGH